MEGEGEEGMREGMEGRRDGKGRKKGGSHDKGCSKCLRYGLWKEGCFFRNVIINHRYSERCANKDLLQLPRVLCYPESPESVSVLVINSFCVSRSAPKGRARGARASPWDLKNTIFSGFLPLNYVIYIFEVFFYAFCYVGGLRKPAAW